MMPSFVYGVVVTEPCHAISQGKKLFRRAGVIYLKKDMGVPDPGFVCLRSQMGQLCNCACGQDGEWEDEQGERCPQGLFFFALLWVH